MSNPYSVPTVTADVLQAEDPLNFRIIGSHLMCGKTAELPEICIVTGTTADLVRIRRKLVWSPRWLLLVLLISPIVMLLSGYPLKVQRQDNGKTFWLTGYAMHFIKAVSQTQPVATAD